MNGRSATRPAARPRRHVACRRVLLCAGIAAVLNSWTCATLATPLAASGPADAAANASGADASFDRSLLSGAGSNTTDISRFEHGNPVLPGTYNTDVYLNARWVGRADVRFAAVGNASATPCVDRRMLDLLGLRPAKLSAGIAAKLQDPKACVGIDSVIPGASMTFDMASLRLDTSVPQAYLGQMPRGYVSPEYWDAGVPAALLDYNFNSYHTSSRGLSQTTSYLGLNAGFNVGPWHVRQDSTVNWQSAAAGAPARRQWHSIDSYVQRDLPSLRAQLTLGDTFTDGQVFDSFGLRGVQLATDDRMLPDSLRGYAPVVRGVADTNAKVTIRQNGVQIYQTTVAPGPFTINDLYPTGYGGSLDVTVTEADGRTRSFSVPYASVAQLLRPGRTRFDIAAGQLRNPSLVHQPDVVQATVQHGFDNLLTGYAGLQGSQGYAALLLGSAINTRYGAFAMDLTEARTRIPGFSSQSGQSLRIGYSKLFPETNTSLSVAAYRYSTSGYLSLTDAALARDYARRGLDAFTFATPPAVTTIDGIPIQTVLTPAQQAALSGTAFNPALNPVVLQHQRSRLNLTLSQRLGEHGGSLYANTSITDYWNSSQDTQFQLGYNNLFHRVSYSISATRTRNALGRYDDEYFVSFSVPLGDSPHAPTLGLNFTHGGSSGTQQQASLNGSAGADNQFNYGTSVTHGNAGTGNAGTINGGYRSPYAVVNASYGHGSGYSQASLGVSGAVVAHPGGITFGQPMGDTVGIVYVPGAEGAHLDNAAGARIDRWGYALVPYLRPYNLNTIRIDPKGLPLDVQLDATSTQVAPHAGAVVMLKFKTESGRTIIVRARLKNGQALPFGAEVFNEKGVSLGLVGQSGMVLMRGVNPAGRLTAHWQDDSGNPHSCAFPYALAPQAKGKHMKSYEEIHVTCTPANASARNG
ncbi:MAG: fimbrial biogenesis outer membrane usher protein [Xanthomonadaceae bacterium]|nr:fimbrial biogenesis outer membrane usher protein [Xanthomonadaceae bacterium]MDE3071135.1 fimbrial biogenesis outer membrane usher protein [Pseudomonadota bacterium]